MPCPFLCLCVFYSTSQHHLAGFLANHLHRPTTNRTAIILTTTTATRTTATSPPLFFSHYADAVAVAVANPAFLSATSATHSHQPPPATSPTPDSHHHAPSQLHDQVNRRYKPSLDLEFL